MTSVEDLRKLAHERGAALTVRECVKVMDFWSRLDFAMRIFWAILRKTI